MKPRVKIIAVTAAALSFFLIGFLYSYYVPQLKTWLLVEIESISRTQLEIGIFPKNINFSILPLGFTFEDVSIVPQNHLKTSIPKIDIAEAKLRISMLNLLRGRLRFSHLVLKEVKTSITIPSLSSKEPFFFPNIDKEVLFRAFESFPLESLELQRSLISITDNNSLLSYTVNNLDFFIHKVDRTLESNIFIEKLDLNNQHKQTVSLQLRLTSLFNEQGLIIDQLELNPPNSHLKLSGNITHIFGSSPNPLLNFKIQGHFNLDDLSRDVKYFYPKLPLPFVHGTAESSFSIKYQNNNTLFASGTLTGSDVRINDFIVGRLSLEGDYSDPHLTLKSFEVENSAGKVSFLDGIVNFSNPVLISGKVSTEGIELHDLLSNLTVGNVPVYLKINGTLPCLMRINKNFEATCRGQLHGRNFSATNGATTPFEIVHLNTFTATGDVSINLNEVKYNADLQIQDSQGSSQGTINYSSGFMIDYQSTNELDFSNIANLVGLRFSGKAKLKGTTQGNSSYALINMNLKTRNFIFEDFQLGNLSSQLQYKEGLLSFTDLQGTLNTSRYQGNVGINLTDESFNLKINSQKIELNDISKSVAKYLNLPFEIFGTGTTDAEVWGPYDLKKISYNIKGQFNKCRVANESFELLNFSSHARKGELIADNIELKKGPSKIKVSGSANLNGLLNLEVDGSNFRLEELESLAQFKTPISGLLSFNTLLTGPIEKPETTLKGSVSNLYINNRPVEDSKFGIHSTPNLLEGTLNFFGNHVSGKFAIPLNNNSPFDLNLQTHDWDYTAYLSLFADEKIEKDYEGTLNSSINLHSDTGGLWKSSGEILIKEFKLQRGNLSLFNDKVLKIIFKDGIIDIENFVLTGNKSDFVATGKGISKDKIDLVITGKTDLSLLQIFTPFLSELSGPMTTNVQMSGSLTNPHLVGSFFIENGYVKSKSFPHPLEKIRADILFNQSKVLINSIKAEFAGGQVLGEGSIEIKDLKNLPTHVYVHFNNVNLNFPDKIQTSGSGSILFSGNWFPFLLSGNYDVSRGLMTMEFNDSALGGGSKKNLLPKFFENRFEPVIIDLQINLDKGVEVKNSQMKGKISGNLRIKGSPERPILVGALHAGSGDKLIFRDTTFDISSSKFTFSENANNNPELYITAQSRVQETYDINLLIQGKADNPEIKLSSHPPLGEQDIISLLALGITSEQMQKESDNRQQASIQIGSAIFSQGINKQTQQNLGLDFQISPAYDETKNTTVPKVTLSRQLTPKLGASVSRTWGSKESTDTARLQYKMNNRLSVVGSYEGKSVQGESINQENNASSSVFGLDLEYKVEFK